MSTAWSGFEKSKGNLNGPPGLSCNSIIYGVAVACEFYERCPVRSMVQHAIFVLEILGDDAIAILHEINLAHHPMRKKRDSRNWLQTRRVIKLLAPVHS